MDGARVRSTSDLVARANDNYQRAFLRMTTNLPDGETREFGPLTALASGLPFPLYNRIFVFAPPPRDALDAAVAWLSGRDVPFWVTVADAALHDAEGVLADLGLVRNGRSSPGMARSSLDDIPPGGSSVAITEVAGAAELADFVAVATEVFGMSRDVSGRVYGAALLADGVRLFLGRVDGQAVACGLLTRTGDVAGVYTIGVAGSFRRRGIGEAMTWGVLRAGRDEGCRVGVLQSSEMGYPLYERMGFETVTTYHQLEPAP